MSYGRILPHGYRGRIGKMINHYMKKASKKQRRSQNKSEVRCGIAEVEDFELPLSLAKERRYSWKKKQSRVLPPKERTYLKLEQVKEIVACLERESRFYYFKDRYALQLLSLFVGEGKKIHEIKKSRFGKLLQKPFVKEALAKQGNGALSRADVDVLWPTTPECFYLDYGVWGEERIYCPGWYQTCRPGRNLVLRLNFSNFHNADFTRLFPCKECHERRFEFGCHPVSKRRYTLAWARIDFSDDWSEALIEELQCDWLRMAEEVEFYIPYSKDCAKCYRSVKKYLKYVLAPYWKIWAEATMSAAIWLLKQEMGVDRVYYHTFESAVYTKHMEKGRKPPRSIYTSLPEKFCFTRTNDPPQFLARHIERATLGKGLSFYELAM